MEDLLNHLDGFFPSKALRAGLRSKRKKKRERKKANHRKISGSRTSSTWRGICDWGKRPMCTARKDWGFTKQRLKVGREGRKSFRGGREGRKKEREEGKKGGRVWLVGTSDYYKIQYSSVRLSRFFPVSDDIRSNIMYMHSYLLALRHSICSNFFHYYYYGYCGKLSNYPIKPYFACCDWLLSCQWLLVYWVILL